MKTLTNQQQMNRLALKIPANYSRKDAGAADPAVLRNEIMQSVKDYKETATKLAADVAKYGAVSSETKEMLERIALRMDGLESQFNRPDGADGAMPLSKTIAELFVESEAFKNFQTRGWHKGGVGMKFKSIWEEAALPQVTGKTTITTSTVGTAGPQAMRVPLIEPQLRELRIRDLIPSTPTQQVVIEYPKENVFTNAASPQVEGSDKAEAALTFTLGTATVRTIAHWIPATRQILDDMDMLMSYIQKRLRYGLKLVEENEILSGSGSGVHLNGLITQATAYDSAGRNVANDTQIDKLSHMMTQARVAEYPVDGVVLHPNDWEKVRLIKDEDGGTTNKGNYVFGDPGSQQVPRLWGAPIVVTTAISAGFALVGAFSLGAEIFDRQEATIDISTEHSDYFTKNLVAIRAEERLALAVYRPGAFIYGAL